MSGCNQNQAQTRAAIRGLSTHPKRKRRHSSAQCSTSRVGPLAVVASDLTWMIFFAWGTHNKKEDSDTSSRHFGMSLILSGNAHNVLCWRDPQLYW